MSFLVKMFVIPGVLFVCVAGCRDSVPVVNHQTIHVPMCEPVKSGPIGWSNDEVRTEIKQIILDMFFTKYLPPRFGGTRRGGTYHFSHRDMRDLQISKLNYGQKAMWYASCGDKVYPQVKYTATFYVDQDERILKLKESTKKKFTNREERYIAR